MSGYINTRKDRENLYGRLNQLDIISKMRWLLDKKGFKIRPDGRWTREPMPSASIWDTPWIHQWQEPAQECDKWHNLFFPAYGLTPSYCLNCWKVVVNPPTLKDLFDLYEIEHDLQLPCKCGFEMRYTDERRYGGYFYNWGKEAGLECYKIVREAVPEHMDVFLKCACSEYEIKNGPPAEWEVTPQQSMLEDAYKKWVLTGDIKHTQQQYMTAFVMLKWIHHAVHIGDLTYKEFTGGQPLVKKMKTYEGELNNG